MIRILTLLLAACLPGLAAINVAHNWADGTTGAGASSFDVTTSPSPTAGNALVVIVANGYANSAPPITTTPSTTCTSRADIGVAQPAHLTIYVCPNIVGSITKVTVANGSYFIGSAKVLEVAAVTATAYDTSSAGIAGSFNASSWSAGATGTLSQAAELVITAAFDYRALSQTFTYNGGFAAVGSVRTGDAGTLTAASVVTAATTAVTATGTVGSTSNSQVLAISVALVDSTPPPPSSARRRSTIVQ